MHLSHDYEGERIINHRPNLKGDCSPNQMFVWSSVFVGVRVRSGRRESARIIMSEITSFLTIFRVFPLIIYDLYNVSCRANTNNLQKCLFLFTKHKYAFPSCRCGSNPRRSSAGQGGAKNIQNGPKFGSRLHLEVGRGVSTDGKAFRRDEVILRIPFDNMSSKNWFQSERFQDCPPDSAPWLRVGISTCQEVGGDRSYLDSEYLTVRLDIIGGCRREREFSETRDEEVGRTAGGAGGRPSSAAAPLPPDTRVLPGPFVSVCALV